MVALLVFLCLYLLPGAATASTLSTAAAALSPGQFAVITPSNSTGDNYPNVYADSASWDPVNHKLYYVGQGDDNNVGYHFIIYDEATNAFSEGPALPGFSPRTCTLYMHGYDLNTIDPATGNFYRGTNRSDSVGWTSCPGPFADLYRYNSVTNTWTALPNNTAEPTSGSCCQAIAWWPELNGVLWAHPGTRKVWIYSETTGLWSLLTTLPSLAGLSNLIAEYDSVNHQMVVGDAGSMYRIATNGTATLIGALPTSGGSYGTGLQGNISAAPVSGNFIYIKDHSSPYPHTPPFYTWNAQTNAQTGPISGVPAANPVYGATTTTPVSNYGLTMSIFCYTSCGLLIYKDGNVAPDTTDPSTPTNLVASPVSSSQINLTWTASTDNVAVTGYQVERCAGASCVNFAQIATPVPNSYNNTGLLASTLYRYRVRATDGAGNLSSYSSIAESTTTSGGGGTTPEQDFTNRCNAGGVIKCWGFDSAADGMTLNTHIFAGDYTTPSQDTVIKTSGTGSLKFTLPASDLNSPCSGGCKANVAGKWEPQGDVLGAFDGTSFGPGSTFYTQFRLRITASHTTNPYDSTWKFFELLYNFSTFGNLGLVWGAKLPVGVVSGTMGASQIQIGSYSDIGGSSPTEFCLGNGYQPYCDATGSSTDARSPYYSIQQFDDGRKCDYAEWFSLGHPDCWYLQGNIWYTFKFKVTYGTAHGFDSHIEGWYAIDGATTWTRFLNTLPTFPLAGVPTNPMTGTVFNTANFSTYMTNLHQCVGCQDAAMWIDEFIISTADIALPGASGGPNPPNAINLSRRRIQ